MLKVKDFCSLNQVQLPDSLIICNSCQAYLSTPIYSRLDGKNMCNRCYEKSWLWNFVKCERNELLEAVLKNYKFNCPTCLQFINSFENVEAHKEQCLAIIRCLYCKYDINVNDIADHLMQYHSNVCIKQDIEEPMATINFCYPLKNEKIFLLNIFGSIYIVFVKCDKNNFLITVTKLFASFPDNLYVDTDNDKFVIQYFNKAMEMKMHGKTFNTIDYFKRGSYYSFGHIEIPISKDIPSEVEIVLFFNGYEKIQKNILECPICLNSLTLEIYQCNNGHSICVNCKKLINNGCAICRGKMNDRKVNLKHVISEEEGLCQNLKNGCLKIITENIDSHIKNCSYRFVNCFICNQIVKLSSIYTHFLKSDSHQLLCINEVNSFDITNSGCNYCNYYRYDNQIFQLNVKCIITSRPIYDFSVKLMYHDEVPLSKHYQYEIHILKNSEDILATYKMFGMCQSSTHQTFSSRIELSSEMCSQINCRLIIYSANRT